MAPHASVRPSALLLFVLSAVPLLPAGALAAQGLPTGDPDALGFDRERLGRAEELIRRLVDSDTLPGAVLLVARKGRVVEARTFGYADLERRVPMRMDHIFRLASATKVWVSTVAMSLYEQDRFGLDTPVAAILPELADLQVFDEEGVPVAAQGSMTVLDLLRHTCGYGYGYEEPIQTAYRRAGILTPGPRLDWTHAWTLDEWARHLASVPMAEEPARFFSYGLCHDILGLLMERVTGKRLDTLLQEEVLDPLGLRDTGFWFDDERAGRLAHVYDVSTGHPVLIDDASTTPFRNRPKALSGGGGWDSPVAYGGLAASAPDFLRLLQMILNGGELDGVRVLGRKTAELFFRNHLAGLESEDSFWPGVGFGLGTAVLYDPARYGEVGSRGTLWWAGSNGASFWVDPREEVVGVLMVQVLPFDVGGFMDRVRRAVMTALSGDPGG